MATEELDEERCYYLRMTALFKTGANNRTWAVRQTEVL